ncbi:MAG: transposase, partial [Bacteroidota bacterium]
LGGIPGIGPLTSIQLLEELGEIDRFPNFKSLNSFIGFIPTTFCFLCCLLFIGSLFEENDR